MEKLVTILCLAQSLCLALPSIETYDIESASEKPELPIIDFYEIEPKFIITNKEDHLQNKGVPFDQAIQTNTKRSK